MAIDSRYLNNRLKYHTASRLPKQAGDSLAASFNVDGHQITTKMVWAAPQNQFPTQSNGTAGVSNDPIGATTNLISIFKQGATSGEFWNGGTVWTNPLYPAVKLYEDVPAVAVTGSDGDCPELGSNGKAAVFQSFEVLDEVFVNTTDTIAVAGKTYYVYDEVLSGYSAATVEAESELNPDNYFEKTITRIKDWIAPTSVEDSKTGSPEAGFTGIYKWDGTALQDNAAWTLDKGNWQFVYIAGLLTFEYSATPQKVKSATITAGTKNKLTVTAFKYVGEYLDEYLDTAITDLQSKEIKVKEGDSYLEVGADGLQTKNLNVSADGNYIKATNTVSGNLVELDDVVGSIKLSKLEQATTGYASSYQLLVDGVVKGATINIPKDQFLKDAKIVEGVYDKDTEVFTASEDITDEQLKKNIKKYIHFIFVIKVKDANLAETNQEKHIYLDIQELCDVYTAGSGLVLNGTEFNVNLGTDDETAKYLSFNTASALVIDGLDVAANGNYVLSSNTVATNLTALDDVIGELSGGTYISGDVVAKDLKRLDDAIKVVGDHKTLTIGTKKYNTETDVTVTAADLGALTSVIAGNDGIAVSETNGQVSISAVVAPNDLHLGISTNGIETSGLVTASGYVISADTTVAANLEALDTEIGDLVSGNYISGDIVASDLTRLDTQVKTNADAIATNADAIANLIKDCNINITSSSITMADTTLTGLLDTAKSNVDVESGVVTIVFNKEVLEIGQREAASVAALSGKFEDVYPDEGFDAETKTTTLSADFGDYLDDKVVQWRITYRG